MADDEEDVERIDDISQGKNADPSNVIQAAMPQAILSKYEVFSYRNAANILKNSFPEHFSEIIAALGTLSITKTQIRTPGGSKSQIAKYVDTLFREDWRETRIAADLQVKLMPPKGDMVFSSYTREGFLDGHRIDFVKGRVALDLEWNSKDQTFDRDLYAFNAFAQCGVVDAAILVTRSRSLDDVFRSVGPALKKDGTPELKRNGEERPTMDKYGASTTWMGKLLYRLNAGRNGGCPVLAIGITPNCVSDWSAE